MPAWLTKLLGAGDPIKSIGDTIDKLSTNAEERGAMKAKALNVVLDAHARIIEADAKAGGMAAAWRPIASLTFVALILWITIAQTFGLPVPDMTGIPAELWAFLMGYGGFRSAEKAVGMFQSRKELKLRAKAGLSTP